MIVYIARALISFLFLFGGMQALLNWGHTNHIAALTLSEWMVHFERNLFLKDSFHFLMEVSPILIGVAIFLQLAGGLLLLCGYRAGLGATFLLLFLVPITPLFHAFWMRIGPAVYEELGAFLKNAALIGALLYLISAPLASSKEK